MYDKETDTHKSTSKCQVLIPLQKVVPLLVSAHSSVVSPKKCFQKVLLFDLESRTRYSLIFLRCVIHEIFCFTHSQFLVPTRKPEVISP